MRRRVCLLRELQSFLPRAHSKNNPPAAQRVAPFSASAAPRSPVRRSKRCALNDSSPPRPASAAPQMAARSMSRSASSASSAGAAASADASSATSAIACVCARCCCCLLAHYYSRSYAFS